MQQGALMADLEGVALSSAEREMLKRDRLGGLILFSRNFESTEQLRELVADVRAIAPDILIAVDHEGGRVQRFRDGFVRLPPAGALAKLAQQDYTRGVAAAKEMGWLMARELLEFGIDISFAPVLDLDWGRSEVIGDRAFGDTAALVSMLAGAYIKGMKEAGMSSTGKHFPGHGWVVADSHKALPVDGREKQIILSADIEPFRQLIGQGLDAVMPSHVIYRKFDDNPAGFSSFWLKEMLRNKLGFKGVIFSDDLTMEGAAFAGGYADRARMALAAGCDMVLACNNSAGALEVLDYLDQVKHPGAEVISRMKADFARQTDSERYSAAVEVAAQLRELA